MLEPSWGARGKPFNTNQCTCISIDFSASVSLVLCVPPLPPLPRPQLHVAAANGYAEVLEFLLCRDNTTLDIADMEGWTPFHAAVCWGQQDAMRRLAVKGANMDIKNLHGETAYGMWTCDIYTMYIYTCRIVSQLHTCTWKYMCIAH